jgi:sulfofructose kinase
VPIFDIAGIGLNATDTVILLPRFPEYAGKIAFHRELIMPGGQVATAMLTCARLGLKTKYIGTVGDDERGRIQLDSLQSSGINLDDVEVRPNCPNQTAYILIDERTGERTVIWKRDDCLRLKPESIREEMITCAGMLHLDGTDSEACARAAEIARANKIPVTVDVDTVYAGFERVLPFVDYLIASSEFPSRWMKEPDPLRALEQLQDKYRIPVVGMTQGSFGALVLTQGQLIYSPGFEVNCVDTTGAGDVFHGAFCYSVLQNKSMREVLEFSNAMAALNCTALGARGGIATLSEVLALMRQAPQSQHGGRRVHPDFAQ